MRYRPEHKVEIHQKIVKDAARRFRSEGLSGSAVSAVMRDSGLTHGGFYKHFESKDDLLLESLRQAFREISERLAEAGKQSRPGTAWKAIVKAYLSPEHCDHAEWGCPVAALASELGRADQAMKAKLVAEIAKYRSSHCSVYARATRRRQGERFPGDLFHNDWSDGNGPYAARSSGTSESAGERQEFSVAEFLSARSRCVVPTLRSGSGRDDNSFVWFGR